MDSSCGGKGMAAGSTVVRFDPRDTGLSGDGGDIYRFTEVADDVRAVRDADDVDRDAWWPCRWAG